MDDPSLAGSKVKVEAGEVVKAVAAESEERVAELLALPTDRVPDLARALAPDAPLRRWALVHTDDPSGTDVPAVWFAARFVQLGLLLLCGVFGFLLVRRYGLGLAIGGTICAGWLVVTTATEQTDRPIGLAVGNPNFTDLQPHIVTIVGVGLMLFFGLVATAMALIDDR